MKRKKKISEEELNRRKKQSRKSIAIDKARNGDFSDPNLYEYNYKKNDGGVNSLMDSLGTLSGSIISKNE